MLQFIGMLVLGALVILISVTFLLSTRKGKVKIYDPTATDNMLLQMWWFIRGKAFNIKYVEELDAINQLKETVGIKRSIRLRLIDQLEEGLAHAEKAEIKINSNEETYQIAKELLDEEDVLIYTVYDITKSETKEDVYVVKHREVR